VTKVDLDETLLGVEEGWPWLPGLEEVTTTLAGGWPTPLGGGYRLPLQGYRGCPRELMRPRPGQWSARVEVGSAPPSSGIYTGVLRESELHEK
jgi:hypothetical protein